MGTLSKNWITEKHIDFEYKQYILLAYLSEVNEFFKENLLYPKFSELIDHYKQLMAIKENKQHFLSSLPKRIRKFDLNKLQIEYENIIEDDVIMKELETIVNYSMQQFEHYLAEGKKIFDFIEKHLTIFPVGIEPIHSKDAGYLLLQDGSNSEIRAYEYEIKLYEQSDVKHKAIYINYIDSYARSITTTMQSVKIELIRKNKTQATPATYAIETSLTFPYEEAFLPIAKRYLVKYIA